MKSSNLSKYFLIPQNQFSRVFESFKYFSISGRLSPTEPAVSKAANNISLHYPSGRECVGLVGRSQGCGQIHFIMANDLSIAGSHSGTSNPRFADTDHWSYFFRLVFPMGAKEKYPSHLSRSTSDSLFPAMTVFAALLNSFDTIRRNEKNRKRDQCKSA